MEIDDASVEIIFPGRGHSSAEDPPRGIPDGLFPDDQLPLVAAGAHITTGVGVVPRTDRAAIHYLRVRVIFNGECSVRDFESEDPDFDAGLRELARAEAIARKATDGLVANARTAHTQYWLGLGGEPPTGIGSGRLEDLDAGRTLPVSRSLKPTLIRRTGPAQIITATTFKDLLRSVERAAQTPSVAESLLADAVYYVDAAEPVDPARALLCAAIACELKIKAILRQAAHGAELDLLELLLTNPRDYSLAASALFDRPLKVVAGVSLREFDKPLWKRIDRLFTQRNHFAHRGVTPMPDHADDGIKAAIEAFGWLDELLGQRSVNSRIGAT